MKGKREMTILLVDDEPVIVLTIHQILLKMGYHEIIEAYTEREAIKQLESTQIDLAVLDINLKLGDEGIGLAKICLEKQIPFFFLSSYSDKRTLDNAVKTAPGAYVFKPFTESDLYSAIALTLSKISVPDNPIIFKDKGNFIKLNQADILYLKADNTYIEIHTKSKSYLQRGSIKKFLAEFDCDQLIKVNRSYAINLKHIKEINATNVSIGEIEIPISRAFKDELMEQFEK
jgi:DNA-binding LytR/AlgR family response regulator